MLFVWLCGEICGRVLRSVVGSGLPSEAAADNATVGGGWRGRWRHSRCAHAAPGSEEQHGRRLGQRWQSGTSHNAVFADVPNADLLSMLGRALRIFCLFVCVCVWPLVL